MQEPMQKKDINPVLDQKIVKVKKTKWLWWLLAILLLLALIFWFNNRGSQTDTRVQPAAQESNQVTSNTSDTNRNVNAVSGTENDNAIAQLDRYFSEDPSDDSDWIGVDSVSFNAGSATPTIQNQEQLNQLVKILNDHPNQQVLIRGFTDSTGSAEANKELSASRANAFKQWLNEHDIDANRLKIEGQGSADPVASNQSSAGRDQNRRVEIKLLASDASKGQ